jgi:Fe-S cluster assembly protein SufD
MTMLGENKDWITESFSQFEKGLNGSSKLPLHQKRKDAIEQYAKVGFPTVALEEWKYTDPKPIFDSKFFALSPKHPASPARPVRSALDSHRFIFVDGVLVERASGALAQGIEVAALADVQKADHPLHQLWATHFATIARTDESFTSINTAFLADGLMIFAQKNAATTKPIEIVFQATKAAAEGALSPRILCIAETGASVTMVERFEGEAGVSYLSNAVVECRVAANAHVHHIRIQDESVDAYHVSMIEAHVEQDSSFRTYTFSFGGKLVRNHVNIVMNGSNANVTMNGLSVLGGQQHVDNTTLLDHAMPHCESLELYKGIYGEKSQGVFSGTIIVREDAQKTNAIQSNRSILLSQDAQVNTKPQLKIWADDVKCTHGATIGQLDDDALFYIQARGVGKKEAKMMLVQAFAGEIIGTLSNDILKDELHERLVEKLEQIA